MVYNQYYEICLCNVMEWNGMEWNGMESWNHGIMESWNHGIMESWKRIEQYFAYL
jgi:hypothetical protein